MSVVTDHSPKNFSWIRVNYLAGSAAVYSENEAKWVKNQGITDVVSTTKKFPFPPFGHCNVKVIAIENFRAPSIHQMTEFYKFCKGVREKNGSILIHCLMGRGRTGTLLAVYLVAFEDKDPEEAIKEIRAKRPGSLENVIQENAVRAFHYWFQNQRKKE